MFCIREVAAVHAIPSPLRELMPEACSYRMLISLHPPCRTLAIHACAHAPHWRSLNMHLRLVCDAMRCLAFPPAHSLAHYAPPAHNLLCDPPPLPACPSAPRRYMRQRLMCDAPPLGPPRRYMRQRLVCEAKGACDMGGFTRILHSGVADDLMDEV